MSKLITHGNIAVFEYPSVDNPSFTLDDDGVLWIEGYTIPFAGKDIRAMRRFETNLKGYQIVGQYYEAKSKIQGDFSEMVQNLNTDCCVVLINTAMGIPISESIIQQ